MTLLWAFINGYIDRECQINNNYKDIFFNFGDFIMKYCNLEYGRAHSWYDHIITFSQSEEEAFDNFYYLFDKFLKEYEKPEEIYSLGMTTTHYKKVAIKEIHHTDHGNPKIDNPHEHEIKQITDDIYYFDVLFLPKEELECTYEYKGHHSKFGSTVEFISYLARGGELEFIFKSKKYSITHPENRLCCTQIGVDSSTVFFDSLNELLEYKIDNNKVKDIVTKIEPYFRRF